MFWEGSSLYSGTKIDGTYENPIFFQMTESLSDSQKWVHVSLRGCIRYPGTCEVLLVSSFRVHDRFKSTRISNWLISYGMTAVAKGFDQWWIIKMWLRNSQIKPTYFLLTYFSSSLIHPSFLPVSFSITPPKNQKQKQWKHVGNHTKLPQISNQSSHLFFFFLKLDFCMRKQNKPNLVSWYLPNRTATRCTKKTATTWHGKITRRTALQVVNFFKAHKISTAVAAHFTNAGCTTGWKVVVAGVVGLVAFLGKKTPRLVGRKFGQVQWEKCENESKNESSSNWFLVWGKGLIEMEFKK